MTSPGRNPLEGIPLLEDLPSVNGRRVLVRVDFNVPLTEDADGRRVVADDFRIRASLPTLEWLTARGASVVACTHLGRPKGRFDERYELSPVRARLSELAPGVELLQNLRFDPGEEECDPVFVEKLVDGFDAYVNDAFGASHRAHASIVGPPSRLPSAAGRLLGREVQVIGGLITDPDRPFVAVVGGAKVCDKLGVLKALLDKVDRLIVGGGMSYTFLAAKGHRVGRSLLDDDSIDDCAELMNKAGSRLVLPLDIVALGPGGELADGAGGTGPSEVVGPDIPDGWEGMDIGPLTVAVFEEALQGARTVLWNGPLGAFEDDRFSLGTRALAESIASSDAFSVVGGGDSVAAIDRLGLASRFSFVSTGGGASLELIEHGDLPGLDALRHAPNAPNPPSARNAPARK